MHDLASRLHALPPSCGPVRLVGVDGHAGSGKSTFAGRLAVELGGAPVLHLDDIATHEQLFDWTGRLLAQVLEPLGRGETAYYTPYDWRTRRFGPPSALPPAPVLLVEGVGAGRRALRPYLAGLLWMELPCEASWARGRLRDGPEQSTFWAGWVRAERAHFRGDPSRPYADFLVRQSPLGYEVLPMPPASPGPDQACRCE
ncbi:uridine kinase [Streptomyces sp. NPDC001544]|uniref:uridine kinase family protein n=1 Tax=Streptomyces sp. NPDC001544 TaxID=3364584 RepID=UPI00369AC338